MSDQPRHTSRWKTLANRTRLLTRRIFGNHEQRRTSTYRPVGRRKRRDHDPE